MITTQWGKFTAEQRLTAAAVDIMNHREFSMLCGILMLGKVVVSEDFPTAATNGRDCYYGAGFMAKQNRAQTRWVMLHENFHKALEHCTQYTDIVKKYPSLSNVAQDFVINALIDEMDPHQAFAERPVGVKILLDKKYYGMSFIQVLRDLLKKKGGGGNGKKGGGGKAGEEGAGDDEGGTLSGDEIDVDAIDSFDKHIQKPFTPAEIDGLRKDIQDAVHQGKRAQSRIAGTGGGNQALDNVMVKRNTDWRTPMLAFVEQICNGYEHSRYCPPNKRLLPLGILMPSHFDEVTGEVHVYCDTSGSMYGVYPVVFGELARIAEIVKPKLLRIIWWDGEVQGEQSFTESNYASIATLIQPSGGGGTTPDCVVSYVAEKKYQPRIGIWLTDGYLDGSNAILPWPVLWGIVDNEDFVPPQGQKINLSSIDIGA